MAPSDPSSCHSAPPQHTGPSHVYPCCCALPWTLLSWLLLLPPRTTPRILLLLALGCQLLPDAAWRRDACGQHLQRLWWLVCGVMVWMMRKRLRSVLHRAVPCQKVVDVSPLGLQPAGVQTHAALQTLAAPLSRCAFASHSDCVHQRAPHAVAPMHVVVQLRLQHD